MADSIEPMGPEDQKRAAVSGQIVELAKAYGLECAVVLAAPDGDSWLLSSVSTLTVDETVAAMESEIEHMLRKPPDVLRRRQL